MVFRGKCEVCSGTNFNVEDGYYYCTECNTQNRTVMEMECDAFDLTMGDEKIKVRGVKLQAEKEAKVELTSWEEYNYIMLGLVNEALALGAPPELKKVVFQLWSRYLQKVNAAFFSKSETALPKLPTNFFKKLAREGHISVFRIDHFFPPNILKNMKRSSFINFQAKYSFPTHSYLRTVTGKLCKELGVKDLKKPDFVSLVKRYVREFCLPEEMGKYLGRLINFQPPEMNFNYTGICPNYEARAIAYVIFMLKWLFGLDDTSEEKMSEASGQVNAKMRNFRRFMPDVFDFVEWMKYIEMRSVVLAEYHMPTSIATKIEGNAENTQKYLEYLNFCKRPGLTTQRSIANSIYNIFEKLSLLHGESDQSSGSKSFSFAPSLTPFRTYFDFLLNHHGENLEIPKFMEIDHSKRTIDPFFRPNRFRNLLVKHGINVCLRKCPESQEMMTVQKTRQTSKTEDLLVSVEIVSADEDCDYEDFGNESEEKPKKPARQVRKKIRKKVPKESAEPEEAENPSKTLLEETVEPKSKGFRKFRKQVPEDSAETPKEVEEPSLSSEILLEDNVEQQKTKGFKKFRKQIPEESAEPSEEAKQPSLTSEVLQEDNMDPGEEILEEPRRNLDQIFLFDDMSDSDDEIRPGPSVADQEMEFFKPHHQYWLHFIPHKPTDWNIRMETFQELLDKLPSSFTWLLRQCSVLTGIDQRTIYIELLTIEKQFTYVLESPDEMFSMVSHRSKEAKKQNASGCKLFLNFW
uniref:TATA box-binding protein-associated factor RNA polymerase I subunit B n=1 Tax=Phlebotomus papatasi TaxID=29031 RepID=A0A1B0D9K8_PHLPP